VEYDLMITRGEGWADKKFCAMTSNLFYETTGKNIKDKYFILAL
jgi:hypothetical protein